MLGIEIEQQLNRQHANVPRRVFETSADEPLGATNRQGVRRAEPSLKDLVIGVSERALDGHGDFGIP